jgi:cholest-4-en-3-one 26-monooxygenase
MTLSGTIEGIDLLADTWERGVPHDQFARLRREAPVYWHPEPEGRGFWAITKHADVRAVSRDAATFSSELGGTLLTDQDEETLAQLRLSILNMDPPRQQRYRRIVSRAFTPSVVAGLTADIERRAVAVVDDVCERGACEFVDEVAARVPIQTIAAMMGLEADQWPRLYELSNALLSGTDAATTAAMEIYALCDAVAAQRRAEPLDDLTTALVNAEVDGERLDDFEVNMFFLTLVVTGNESTRNLINLSALALVDHPAEADRLRTDPSTWATGVDELLRWGTSVHSFRRTATRDTEIRGVPVAEGDKVVMYYSSANRDEEVFADPETFDVTRSPNDHLTFGGGGVHHCLGASLARAQIGATMRQVVERLPDLAPAGPVTRLRSDVMNGIAALPVTFTPTPRAGAQSR